MKKLLALLLCFSMTAALFACGGTETPVDTSPSDSVSSAGTSHSSDTDSEKGSSSGTSEDAVEEPTEDPVPNLVIANDQYQDRVVVYDFDQYEEGKTLEDLEVWSVETGHAAGVKYRENTVFGDVVIVGGSKSAIYEYPSGKELWSTTNPGRNTHSVEILPSGNIVLANSDGSCLRLFYASAALEGDEVTAQKFVDYELRGAHGVLWDSEYDVLWGLGIGELVAYSLTGSGSSEQLRLVQGMGTSFSGLGLKGGGHDLQPDYTDTRYLYFTAGNAYRFDKEENEVVSFPHADSYQLDEIKGFSNNPNGRVFSTGELGGKGKFFEEFWKESWLTDTILYYVKRERRGKIYIEKIAVAAEESAFYKVHSFYGEYQ